MVMVIVFLGETELLKLAWMLALSEEMEFERSFYSAWETLLTATRVGVRLRLLLLLLLLMFLLHPSCSLTVTLRRRGP